jgi:hypothetical protein
VTEHRRRARWYATMTHPSYQDMLVLPPKRAGEENGC